jgi:hypothetical protein
MKRYFILLFLLGSNFCIAQKIKKTETQFTITLNPLAFIDVQGGYSYRIGAEAKIKNNIAGLVEIGKYYSYGGNSKTDIRHNAKGYLIKPAIKYYLNKEKKCIGNYLSLEYLHKEINFNYDDSIKIGTTPTYQKRYNIGKNINAYTAKYGNAKLYKSGIVLDWFVGLGARFTSGGNNLSDIEQKGLLTGEGHGDLIGEGQRSIYKVLPNFSWGFKIGYCFK